MNKIAQRIAIESEPGVPTEPGVIPLCVPEIHGNEWVYVKECLDTNWVSSVGSFVDRFETELAARVGGRYAVAVASGTAALHIALQVGGVTAEDEVLMPDLTFIAPANAVRYLGAWPVFIDIEPDYWQMDPQKTADFISKECRWKDGILRNRRSDRRIKALLPVDLLGHPADLDPLLELARKYDLIVVEDATESLGSVYKGQKIGSVSDITCFSFNGNKIITTGGGGMVVTNREKWAKRARYLTTQAKDDPLEFIHREIGYNYRLTNIQAAIGCAQLEKLDEYIEKKRRIATNYTEGFRGIEGIVHMMEAPWAFSTYWINTILVDPSQFGMDSRMLLQQMRERGIQTRPLWNPLHLNPAHADCQPYDCRNAQIVHQRGLSIPSSVGLATDDQERVIEVVRTAHSGTSHSLATGTGC
jgi:aminotransferase in exopolysaccharide biosynthesis